jgi:hypothetical protein
MSLRETDVIHTPQHSPPPIRLCQVGVGAVHPGQKPVDHLHRDLGPSLYQLRTPPLHVVVVEQIAHLRTGPAGLRQHGGDDAIGRASQEVPDEGAANAETHHHELLDAQVIHQAEMVIGVGVPRPVDLEWAGGLAAVGVTQVRRDAAVLALELHDRVERIGQAGSSNSAHRRR